jgi:endonuclease/exonuclease/phosphatase family metal-dependent hydrolase
LSNTLKIISLNIEQDKHLERFIPFIQHERPDIVLLQEVLDKDVAYIEKKLAMKSQFSALNFLKRNNESPLLGIASFTALPLLKHYEVYYKRDSSHPPIINEGEPEKMSRSILVTEIRKEEEIFCLINTHFTWSPNGLPSEQQYQDLNNLFQLLSKIPQFVLCGDFNAPRGGPIFNSIASKYKDNIPENIKSSIDKHLHKVKDLKLMVDGLFTTPNYKVESVDMVDGLSDHCAILAEIKLIK